MINKNNKGKRKIFKKKSCTKSKHWNMEYFHQFFFLFLNSIRIMNIVNTYELSRLLLIIETRSELCIRFGIIILYQNLPVTYSNAIFSHIVQCVCNVRIVIVPSFEVRIFIMYWALSRGAFQNVVEYLVLNYRIGTTSPYAFE